MEGAATPDLEADGLARRPASAARKRASQAAADTPPAARPAPPRACSRHFTALLIQCDIGAAATQLLMG